jgi:hypothetical protein
VYAGGVIDKRQLREMVEVFVAAFAAVMEEHLHEVFADPVARRPAPRAIPEASLAPPQPKRAAPKRRRAKQQAKPTKQPRRAQPAKPQPAAVAAPAAPAEPPAKHAGTPRANVDALVEEAWARRQAEQATPTTG